MGEGRRGVLALSRAHLPHPRQHPRVHPARKWRSAPLNSSDAAHPSQIKVTWSGRKIVYFFKGPLVFMESYKYLVVDMSV